MLRVGLTGGLGSGKSAVGAVFAEGGAHVFSADDIGRALMQPGEPVYAQIVEHFGPGVVGTDGLLDRRVLARLAFDEGRLPELNAIVHPAVLRAQAELLDEVEKNDPAGIAVVESALIFEVSSDAVSRHTVSRDTAQAANRTAPGASPGAGSGSGPAKDWRSRFDKLVLVTAPDDLKVARYVARVAPPETRPGTRPDTRPDATQELRARLAADARARLAAQIPDAEKIPLCDYVIENTETLVLLRRKAQAVLAALRREYQRSAGVQETPVNSDKMMNKNRSADTESAATRRPSSRNTRHV
jgi:dephospho-CoA kinase